MSGGTSEYVMGIYNKTINSSSFSSLPNEKYYNNYTTTTYQGHALTETSRWYNDNLSNFSSSSSYYWLDRGGYYNNTTSAGLFSVFTYSGGSDSSVSTRMVVTNE